MESLLKLEDMGYVFAVDKTDIVFNFKSGAIPDIQIAENLFENIKINKNKVINFLQTRYSKKCHEEALLKEYLPYSSGECYGKQITHNSEVFIQMLDNEKWTAYRMTWEQRNEKSTSEKIIVETSDFFEAINRTEKYIVNFIDFLSANN